MVVLRQFLRQTVEGSLVRHRALTCRNDGEHLVGMGTLGKVDESLPVRHGDILRTQVAVVALHVARYESEGVFPAMEHNAAANSIREAAQALQPAIETRFVLSP